MTKKIFYMLALGCQLMFMSAGCGQEAADEDEDETETEAEGEDETEEAEEPAEDEGGDEAAEAQPEGETGGGGGVCDRAQRCCEAYVTEMNSHMPAGAPQQTAETSCAGIAAARLSPTTADSACTQTIAGFRQGLSAMPGATVPADCAE